MNDPKIGERYKHKYANIIIVINKETTRLADYGKVVYFTISEKYKCEERLDTFREAWELIIYNAAEIKMLIDKLEL